MSRIFDALQRSEAERVGDDSSALLQATDVLRRAELIAASKWKAAALLEQAETAVVQERDASVRPQETDGVVSAGETTAAAEPVATDAGANVFSQLQDLQVSLPAHGRLVCLTDKESAAAEAFRLLGVRLRYLRRDRPLKRVLITSTIPQEGKSVVAANLACTLAQATQQKVLLLEGDVRRPSLSPMFGLGSNPGLCEWLQGERGPMVSIYRLDAAGIWFLPAGRSPSNLVELLQSRRLSALLEQLAAWFEWIIVDSPPVLPIADTSVWTRLADGILLVARQGVTEKRHLQRGLEAIEPQKLIGALLNCSKNMPHSDYYYLPSSKTRPTSNTKK